MENHNQFQVEGGNPTKDNTHGYNDVVETTLVSFNGNCYNCSEPGHMVRYFPKKGKLNGMKCEFYGKLGHIENRCWSKYPGVNLFFKGNLKTDTSGANVINDRYEVLVTSIMCH